MAKTNGPLLSFDARGSLGETLVYSTWKGIPYARRYVVPANPDTLAQQETRSTFAWLQRVWSYMPANVQAGWAAYASGQAMTDRNAFTKFNLSDLRSETDLANFIMSPAAKSGPVAAGMTVTPGNDQFTVDVAAPDLPTGWSITKAIVGAIRDQDPQSGSLYEIVSGEDATSTYQVILSGLADAADYMVGGWFQYERADGTAAYGPAIMEAATTT